MARSLEIDPELRFTCQGTGHCCQAFGVPVADEQRTHVLEGLRVREVFDDLGDRTLFREIGSSDEGPLWQIAPREDGRCPFLSDDMRCRLHARFGPEAKPLACRLYPMTLVEAPDGVHVGLRFSCPTVARGVGDRLADRREELAELAGADARAVSGRISEPLTIEGNEYGWDEVLELEDRLCRTLEEEAIPLPRRVALLMETYDLLARSPGSGPGPKRRTFWDALSDGLIEQARTPPSDPDRPGRFDRVLLRQTAAFFLQGGGGELAGMGRLGKARRSLASLGRGLLFMVGWGAVPPGRGAHTPTEAREAPRPSFSAAREVDPGVILDDPDGDLARYLRTKVRGQGFFGPLCHGLAFGDGLRFLALLLPVVSLFAQAHAAGEDRDEVARPDLIAALRTVDHGHGAAPVFGGLLGRARLKLARARCLPRRFAHALADGEPVF